MWLLISLFIMVITGIVYSVCPKNPEQEPEFLLTVFQTVYQLEATRTLLEQYLPPNSTTISVIPSQNNTFQLSVHCNQTIPQDPQSLAKRLQQNRALWSVVFADDEEFQLQSVYSYPDSVAWKRLEKAFWKEVTARHKNWNIKDRLLRF